MNLFFRLKNFTCIKGKIFYLFKKQVILKKDKKRKITHNELCDGDDHTRIIYILAVTPRCFFGSFERRTNMGILLVGAFFLPWSCLVWGIVVYPLGRFQT